MTALHELGAGEAAAAIRQGDITAAALAEALLARSLALEGLNAFVTLDPDAVRAAAAAADRARRSDAALGPLHGVPIALKDNIGTRDLPTTAGTPALRRHRPARNAPVADALFDAGAILFGKAGMHELAFGITCNNAAFGAVRNPYDPSRVPGGSSGGSGAAVGARLVPAALGTDTGASIRLPANWCGAAGLRPSVGRWPGAGIVPISATRDTAGPIARSVADLALIDAVVTGETALPATPDPRRLRLGVPRHPFWDDLDPECARVANEAMARLEAAGVTLVEVELAAIAAAEPGFGFAIALHEFQRDMTAYLATHADGIAFADVIAEVASPDVKGLLAGYAGGAAAVPAARYRAAMEVERPRLIEDYRRAFAATGIDALVYPTSPLLPPPIGDDDLTPLNGRPVPTFMTAARNLGPVTLAGLPSLSLPAGLSTGGLPVGLTFDAPAGRDRALLALGLVVEALLPPLPAPQQEV
ncbi:MAG TPA: indoleacetamide hydrolase [Hyphomicrobiales bacterium]|nr:indoleacetamide hydrolase [Hyphomicrobiales bacterium]